MFKKDLKEMFEFYEVDNNKKFNIYYKKFKSLNNDDYVKECISKIYFTWKPEFGKKIPSISEIIKYEDNTEIEKAWSHFKMNYANTEYFKKIDDMSLTLREYLGGLEYIDNEFVKDNGTWLKKEFEKAYKLYKAGGLKPKKDKSEYLKIENSTIKLPGKIDKNRLNPMLAKEIINNNLLQLEA